MTVSPIVATMPPMTVSSTMTFTSTCLRVARESASAIRCALRVVERHGRAHFGHRVLASLRGERDEPVDDRGQVVARGPRRR